jgi:putative nucleotidyltransferase with HDIG domain
VVDSPDWLRTVLAATVIFVFTTFPMATVRALRSSGSILKVWKRQHLPDLPYFAGAAVLAWGFHRLSLAAGWAVALMAVPIVYLVYRLYRLYRSQYEDSRQHEEEMSSLHMRTIETLALAVEAKDTTTSAHLRRVQVYAMEVGRELGLKGEELMALRAAAILHDIGKLAVPEYIISKPGRLTPDEFDKMKVHPVVGAEIVECVQFPYPVAPIVRAHHEKWNGTGYPYGLRGDAIPLGARILAAVDTLDALASDRQYRRALPLDEAMAKVSGESGKSFDPAVVEVLQRRYVELEQMAQQSTLMDLKLSVDVKVEPGLAPGAGFEQTRTLNIALPVKKSGEAADCLLYSRNQLQRLVSDGVAAGDMDLADFCAVFSLRLKRTVPFDAFVLWLVREGALDPVFVHGHDHRLLSSLCIPVGHGLSGWVVENNKPILNGNPCVESGYLNDSSMMGTLGSALAVPLESSGRVLGVLALYEDSRDAFTKDHLSIMLGLAPRIADAVEHFAPRAASTHTVPGAGHTDSATLLRHIENEINRSRRLNLPLGVILCSLEGGRTGTPDTDAALRILTGALTEGRNECESLARISDAEFALVISGTTRQALQARLARLARIPLPGIGLRVATGGALFPEDGDEPAQLIGTAEQRLMKMRTPGHTTTEEGGRRVGAGWVQ